MNPYSPPQSPPMEPTPLPTQKRPISVWIVLFLEAVIATALLVGTTRYFVAIATGSAAGLDNTALAIGIIWHVVIVALCVGPLLGAYHRKQWGRWFGVLMLVGLAALSVLAPDRTVYAGDAEKTGASFGRNFLFPGLFIWLAYAFAFSDKAKRYFSGA